MEPPGILPPDKDKILLQQQQQSNVNISTSITTSSNQITTSSSIGSVSSTGHQPVIERLSRPMAFDKMETLVKEMQDAESGVPVRSQKIFLTSIPSAFMGYDLIEWLMERLTIEESEALNIANQLCLHGYFFPVNDSKTLVVKDDSSLYRFQTPYYWPWQHKVPDQIEYAIYLAKRSLRNKQRHGLEEYETEAFANLHKNLKGKWDFITMQAEEQVKLAKERKKGDKIVGDSQERAYWRVHRPPPGQFTPLEPCPVPSRDRQGKPRRRTVEDWQREVEILMASLGRTRMKMSQACECLVTYCETFAEYDPMTQQPLPSNPWVSEDTTFWQLNSAIVDVATEKRVRRWAISIEEIVSDPTGLQEFTTYLKKEYSHENIRFWLAVNDLRRSSHSLIAKKVKEIYEEFLAPGAPCEINIDGKTMENVQQGLKTPTRFAFDSAADHIYTLLLKKDCYPRFVRSEHYKSLLATGIQPSHKKRFFNFGGVAKKKSTNTAPNPALLAQASTNPISSAPSNLTRRRGSDRSLSGSAHELAVSGVKVDSKVPPHSHSQSNLSDIPYRGDMPTGSLPVTAEHIVSVTLNTVAEVTPNEVKFQAQSQHEGSKSFPDTLEPTIEGTLIGACAVCPWETNENSSSVALPQPNVSVSVCPWEDDMSLSSTGAKSIASAPSTSTLSSDFKIKSTSFDVKLDVSEVSEKMKRSCGLRQNTLDSDFHSTKRLSSTVVEQRRASVTVSPRYSDLHYQPNPDTSSFTKQERYQLPIQPLLQGRTMPCTFAPNMNTSLTIARAKSFEETNVGNLLMQSVTITEEDSNNFASNAAQSQHQKCESLISNVDNSINNNKSIIDDNNELLKKSDKYTVTQIKNTESDNNDDSININEVLASSANYILGLSDLDSISNLGHNLSNISSAAATPSINVMLCPKIEIELKEDDNLDYEQTEKDNDCTQNSREELSKDGLKSETLICIVEEDTPANTESIDEPSETQQLPPSSTHHQLSVVKQIYISEDDAIMTDDLSPTTDEYQECVPLFDPNRVDNEEYGSCHLAPGCVAPAPTPAPLIAPLAEVEFDPPDDELEGDVKKAEESKDVEEHKKRRKRRSHDKVDSQDKTSTSDEQSNSANPNDQFVVCPWDDENEAATVDQPFVKTYSTLGYL